VVVRAGLRHVAAVGAGQCGTVQGQAFGAERALASRRDDGLKRTVSQRAQSADGIGDRVAAQVERAARQQNLRRRRQREGVAELERAIADDGLAAVGAGAAQGQRAAAQLGQPAGDVRREQRRGSERRVGVAAAAQRDGERVRGRIAEAGAGDREAGDLTAGRAGRGLASRRYDRCRTPER